MPLCKFILDEDLAHLFHLVRFREGVLGLKVENLGTTFMSEDVMTTLDSLSEPKS